MHNEDPEPAGQTTAVILLVIVLGALIGASFSVMILLMTGRG